MTVLGGIGFTAPWLLLALMALPILWLILRAVPPAPIRRRFPGVALLLGLQDDDTVTDRTPWWLLVLRMLAVAGLILGLAGPVLNPTQSQEAGTGPLVVVLDGSWAGAAEWTKARAATLAQLDTASQQNRQTALVVLTAPEPPVFLAASTVAERVAALDPQPWQPHPEALSQVQQALSAVASFDTLWVSDGLTYPGHQETLDFFQSKGRVTALQSGRAPIGLKPSRYVDGVVELRALRPDGGAAQTLAVAAHGTDPAGNAAILTRAPLTFEAGATKGQVELSLQAELRARITRFAVEGYRSAGATTLIDDTLRRREVALIAGREDREGLQLLSPLHYLRQALEPSVDLLSAPLQDVLPANPDVIVLADVAVLSEDESASLQAWVESGGMLVRFAGPRVAASDVSREPPSSAPRKRGA